MKIIATQNMGIEQSTMPRLVEAMSNVPLHHQPANTPTTIPMMVANRVPVPTRTKVGTIARPTT